MIRRTRIKICGLTREEDLQYALDLGVDAIGLVLCQQSSRFISTERARALAEQMTPFVTLVGLFMDNSIDEIKRAVDTLPLSLLQFHGAESGSLCRQFGIPYMKAIPMGEAVDFTTIVQEYADARGLIVDSHAAGQVGGSGEKFDWQRLPSSLSKPIVLAGGLNPDNVEQAIREVCPYGVDVSSGVEVAKGIKDSQKMARFVAAVRQADNKKSIK